MKMNVLRKSCAFLLVLFANFIILSAQNAKVSAFKHLDLGFNVGTTGIGINLASPINEKVQLRAGLDVMPQFDYMMNFGVESGRLDDQGKWIETDFSKIAKLLKSFSGYDVDNSIDMRGNPTFINGSLLVDVFPFKNKKWHLTAGFYFGSSRVAKAENTTEDMPTLLSINIYNKIYENVKNEEPIIEYEGEGVELPPAINQKILNYGRAGVHMGNYVRDVYDSNGEKVHSKGDPYMMIPDANGMVKAKAKVNAIRPYLGFGYGNAIASKGKVSVCLDCGLMLWGGKPNLVAHDGVDLINDVENVSGKVGDYIKLAKKLTAYPVINLRISRRLF